MVPTGLLSNMLRRAACRASRRSQHRRLTATSWLTLCLCLLAALASAPRAAEGLARQAVLDKTFTGASIVDTPTSSGLPNVSAASLRAEPVSAGDQWMATYGGLLDDSIASVAQTQDGGFVVAGQTESFGAGSADVWVLRLKTDGSIAWQKTYGAPDRYETASFVQEAQDGSLYVVGNSSSNFGSYRLWVLKLRSDGSIAWQNQYRNDLDLTGATTAQLAGDGSLIIVGYAGEDALLLHLHSNGSISWQRSYTVECCPPHIPFAVNTTSDGGFVAAGYDGGSDLGWITRLDAAGNPLWHRSYSGWSGVMLVRAIHQLADGSFMGVGLAVSPISRWPYTEIWVAKFASNGSPLWQKTHYTPHGTLDLMGHKTADGGFILAAQGYDQLLAAQGYDQPLLMKLSPNGDVMWRKSYSRFDRDYLNDVTELSGGGFIAAGSASSSGNGASDAWIVKLDANGAIQPCSVIHAGASVVIDNQISIFTTTLRILTPTLQISQTAIVPANTPVQARYRCQAGLPEANLISPTTIATAAGLPGVIAVSPTDAATSAQLRPQYTLDGGKSWLITYPYSPTLAFVGIVPRNTAQNAVRWLVADRENLYRSGDWGQTWAFAHSGDGFVISPKNPQHIYSIDYAPINPYDLPVGLINRSTDGGVTWNRLVVTSSSIDQLLPSPAAAQDGFYHDGSGWHRFGSDATLPFPDGIARIALDGVNAGRIYGVTSTFNAGQTSPDGGHTWVPWASIPPSVCVQLLAHPTRSNTLYLRCDAGLYRSVNGGTSWTRITQIQGDALAPNLGVPGQLLWSHSGCLWASGNDGTSWTRVSCFSGYQTSRFLPTVRR